MNKSTTIKIVTEKSYILDNNGKRIAQVDPARGELYTRNDYSGLQTLLGKFDTKKHTMKEWKLWMKVKDKLTECYLKENKKLELSLDEAAFLKGFLEQLAGENSHDSKKQPQEQQSFQEFELRTLLGILEQFE